MGQIMMQGHCDSSIRASTSRRDVSTCHPDVEPTAGCCCHPGCSQGVCIILTFERNIVYQPKGANSTFVGTTFAHGLDNFTFNHNVYFADGQPHDAPMFNSSELGIGGASFSEWQRHSMDANS